MSLYPRHSAPWPPRVFRPASENTGESVALFPRKHRAPDIDYRKMVEELAELGHEDSFEIDQVDRDEFGRITTIWGSRVRRGRAVSALILGEIT